MDDLVKRLRENAIREGFVDNLDIEAANCITGLADEIERLRAALQLIAADVTGNKHHQAQFRQDTAIEQIYEEKLQLQMLNQIDDLSPGRCVSWYMMCSYLYYQKDESVISDELFDQICKKILDNWKDIKHPHKRRIKKSDLEAGTGYAIKKYPSIVMSSADRWLAGEYDGPAD